MSVTKPLDTNAAASTSKCLSRNILNDCMRSIRSSEVDDHAATKLIAPSTLKIT